MHLLPESSPTLESHPSSPNTREHVSLCKLMFSPEIPENMREIENYAFAS